MTNARDTAYAMYAPGVTEDTSVYGIWCAGWMAALDEAMQLCRDYSGRDGSVYIGDVLSALEVLAKATKESA